MKKKNNLFTYIISMGLPAIILTGVLLFVENYPFGNNNFALWNMDYQYLDFFQWLKRVVNGEANIAYSFGKSLGDNTIGLWSFYLSSPFNLLLFFFKDIQLFIVVLAITKIAFAGLTCCIYLRKRFENLSGMWAVLLSVSYSMMTYSIKQITNIMWLDGVVFLPLVMLGVYRVITENKKVFLYIITVVAVISNWYTAYMICLLSVFYFVYEVNQLNNQGLKQILIKFKNYCLTMVLSVLTTMFFFIPMAIQLLNGKGIEHEKFFRFQFRCNIWDVVKALFPINANVDNSNILILFCGSLTLVGTILYFVTKNIGIRQKICGGVLLLVLIVSDVFYPTEKIWNGFRKVASYYSRLAFVICFFMVLLAATYFNTRRKIKNFKVVAVICTILVVGELFYNTNIYISSFSIKNTKEYNSYVSNARRQINEIKNYDNSTFYRVEQTGSRVTKPKNTFGAFNEGMAYGYMPLASYSSTFNNSIMKLYSKCGYSECKRVIIYKEPILVSDSLLGIKYLLSKKAPLGYKKVKSIEKYNKKSVYENPYALGLGYLTYKDVYKDIVAENSFEYQNKLLSGIVGEQVNVFKKVKSRKISKNGKITWVMNSPKCSNVLYGYLTRRYENKVDLYVDGKLRTDYGQWNSYKTVQISQDKRGQKHTVAMKGKIFKTSGIRGMFYYLDMEEFRRVIKLLKKNNFFPDIMKDGYVEGDYNAGKKGQLLLTIPYDKGWSIKCNGKKAEVKVAQGIFTVINVDKGKNHIVMEYHTPGFKAGIIVSVMALLCFILWQVKTNKRTYNVDLANSKC